jgi:hypothetical protein
MRLSRLLTATVLGALVLAGGASGGTPPFALFDVNTDLAGPSHNTYGDVKVWKRQAALAGRTRGAALVRCASDCTFGPGWLAFSRNPALSAGDVLAAKAHRSKQGWGVVLTLSPHGWSSWKGFSRRASLSGNTRGVPDALVLVLNGTIVAQPLANRLRQGKTTVEIPGLTRANALRVAKFLS